MNLSTETIAAIEPLSATVATRKALTKEQETLFASQAENQALIDNGERSGDFNDADLIARISAARVKLPMIATKLSSLTTRFADLEAAEAAAIIPAYLELNRRAGAARRWVKSDADEFLLRFIPENVQREILVEEIARVAEPIASAEGLAYQFGQMSVKIAAERGRLGALVLSAITALQGGEAITTPQAS